MAAPDAFSRQELLIFTIARLLHEKSYEYEGLPTIHMFGTQAGSMSKEKIEGFSPDIINALKIDLLAVMSQYLVVGEEVQEFVIRRLDESVFLVSNIRVKELPRATTN